MSDLTTEEKVYLIKCFYSTGKEYANAYRGFRTKFGQHKVSSENTLKRYKKILIHVHVLSYEFFELNFTQMHFFYRIIDNFIQYSTFQNHI